MADKKTNAMRILDNEGIAYTVHTYDASDGVVDGVTAARKLGQDPDQVFKTLVTRGNDRQFYVFVIPVKEELDLKACARSVDVRSVEMIHVKDLLKLIGYERGSVSPVGVKKNKGIVFDDEVLNHEEIEISAGTMGLGLKLKTKDILDYLNADVKDIVKE